VRRPTLSPGVRSALTYAVILAIVFAGSLAAAFVFTHEPKRDTISVGVSSIPAQPRTERIAAGSIVEAREDRLVIRGESGRIEIALPAGLPKDDLQRLAGPAELFATGTRVNVGGEQTQFGLVVTGIVAVDGAPR